MEKTNEQLSKEIQKMKELNEGLYFKIGSLELANSELHKQKKCAECQRKISGNQRRESLKNDGLNKVRNGNYGEEFVEEKKNLQSQQKEKDKLYEKIGELENKNDDLENSLKEVKISNKILKTNLKNSTIKLNQTESDRNSFEATLVHNSCANW